MKHKLLILTASLLLSGLALQAQQVSKVTGNWGPRGMHIEQSDGNTIQVTFSVDEYSFENTTINGKSMVNLTLPGVFLPSEAGKPNLPGTGRYIAIPNGATATVQILDARTEIIPNVEIAPAPVIPKETENGLKFVPNQEVYTKNALYPASPVKLSGNKKIRGVNAVMLGFTPFQYNPVTKELTVYKDIRVSINLQGGDGSYGETRLRSRWFDPLLEDLLLNPEVLPKMNYDQTIANTDATGCEYLVITPNGAVFQQWADSIVKFRTKQGIYSQRKTLADIGGSTTTAIENYINNAYNNWDIPPVAILIIGDYGTDANTTVTSPIWDSYCVSDNIYGDVDADMMPEIVMARMTAQNATHLQTMVRKFIDYEWQPPTNPNFYAHPITALGWQTERWFQICSEVIGGFWTDMGKSPVRINAVYDGDPTVDPWSTATNTSTVVNYFGPSGLGYIPSTPQGIGGFSGGTPAQVVTALNAGSFMLQHRDHGLEDGWGEPAFMSSNISSLTNTDLSFIMSVNCLTGKYNYSSEVFAEKFHRYTYGGVPAGALGIIAASEVSYSFVNDAYIWGVYDNMWPSFMPAYGSTPPERGILPAFGNAAGKYFLEQSSWPYNTSNKEVTYNLFHHHGDAFTMVCSEVPQTLSVTHAATIVTGATSFNVTANAGSLICLTLNGVILGTATGTGSPVAVTIPGTQVPPDEIRVVVTKQNFKRYEGAVLVIAPSGPFVIQNNVTVVDATGNNNGEADFGENITLNVTLENVGVSTASNVTATLSETDPYVVITDNTQNFGNINASATATQTNAYAFHLADSVPDGHIIAFSLAITDGTNNWSGNFNITANAPLLNVTNYLIEDPTGNNNGRLDPGENTNMKITTANIGHSNITSVQATLTTTDPNVTITGSPQTIPAINASASQIPSFGVNVSSSATLGEVAMFIYTAQSGDYKVVDTVYQTIGLVSEDWECNGFTHFNWVNTSASPWTITNTLPYEGLYCAQSGTISDQQTSVLQITMNVVSNDSISFYRKVSSEATYDFLYFYIDGAQQGEWSGEVAWGRAAYPVTAGSHTFKWEYSKDYSVSNGSDKTWVDYILFPPVSGLVAVDDVADAVWTIYPNPSTGAFYIDLHGLKDKKVNVQILNNLGQLVYSNASVSTETTEPLNVNLGKSAAGMYQVRITGDQTSVNKTIVIK